MYLQKTYNQKTERMNYKIVIKFKSEGSNKRVPKEDVHLVKREEKLLDIISHEKSKLKS